MRPSRRIPMLPLLPQSVSFPGLRAIVSGALALFVGTILQGDGILENSSILGVS